ncbi:MAG: peptidoglycan bridge formation glycyltransferase FemA/FemB family protein [Patescibacteria group bacterium]
MNLEYISDERKDEFNDFVLKNGGSFLQSFEWGDFQKRSGKDLFRIIIKDNSNILLSVLILKYPQPFKKSYLYIPYGPIFFSDSSKEDRDKAFNILLDEIRKIAKNESVIFIKIEQDNSQIKATLGNFNFKKSDKDIQARETLILNLLKSEDDLLKDMKQKTKYNIKIALKHKVIVKEIEDKEEAFNAFYNLLEVTSVRNGFRLHPKVYYHNMVEIFFYKAKDSQVGFSERIFFAEYGGKILSCALVGFFGNRATYLHGASLNESRQVMAPHLLHWEIIRKAKELGFSEYDFWGIVTEKTKKDEVKKWAGFSRFKMGFSGDVVEYDGAYDLVLNNFWYFVYRIARKIL